MPEIPPRSHSSRTTPQLSVSFAREFDIVDDPCTMRISSRKGRTARGLWGGGGNVALWGGGGWRVWEAL